MENKIETTIKGNRGSNVKVVNVIGKDDELAKYNLIDEKIGDKQKIEKAFSDRLSYAEKNYTQQLPKELQEDFEIKSEKIGNNIEFITKAKTDVAYEKFPAKIKFSCKLDNIKGLENFDYSNFSKIIQELYEKQKTLIIEEPYNVKRYIGEFEDPTSLFSTPDKIVGSKFFIQPQLFPQALSYNILLYNEYFEFELENVFLRIMRIDNGIYTLSNYESKLDKFYIELKLTPIDKSASFSIHFELKEKYRTDCKAVCMFIKLRILLNDKKSTLAIKLSDSNHNFLYSSNIGDKYFNKKQYKQFKDKFFVFDKLIYIEKVKNIKFIYDEDKLMKYNQLINLTYNDIKRKNYTFKGNTCWINIIQVDEIEEYNKIKKSDQTVDIVTRLQEIELFGIKLNLLNHELFLEKCKVQSIWNENGINKIQVITPKAIYKVLKDEED